MKDAPHHARAKFSHLAVSYHSCAALSNVIGKRQGQSSVEGYICQESLKANSTSASQTALFYATATLSDRRQVYTHSICQKRHQDLSVMLCH